MQLNASLAINNLSFGFCSYHILSELKSRNISPNLFPIGGNGDISCFDKAGADFGKYVQECATKATLSYSRSVPTLKFWHIAGSESSPSDKNYLYTCHETDTITPTELNILNNQTKIFTPSEYTKNVMESYGVKTPVVYIPFGFDSQHCFVTNKKYYSNPVTVWGVFGKFEDLRKAHTKVIRAWIKKFANNPAHVLHLHVYNNFFSADQNNQVIGNVFEGKRYSNINILPYTKTLSELNECYNAVDIVLDGGRGEAWSIPSFLVTALGKHAVVHNCTGLKSWANADNAVLVESTSKIRAVDGIFFHDGSATNQGNFFDFEESDFIVGMDKALDRKNNNKVNTHGLKLQQDFTWAKTVDKILKEMQ